MTTDTMELTAVETFEVRKEIEIAAPLEVSFLALLDELGPEGRMPDGQPFPMKIEPWPGGRWYRDLGHSTGHLWGHVQVIKPPTLLEICGPLMMSYPAANHVQFRLKAAGDRTRVTLLHRALGVIPPEHRDGLPEGWEHGLKRIREIAESRRGPRPSSER